MIRVIGICVSLLSLVSSAQAQELMLCEAKHLEIKKRMEDLEYSAQRYLECKNGLPTCSPGDWRGNVPYIAQDIGYIISKARGLSCHTRGDFLPYERRAVTIMRSVS